MCKFVSEGVEAAHIQELLKAEAEGRLVVLPCKVGDKCYTAELNCKDNPNPTRYCFCLGKSCKNCDRSYPYIFETAHATANIRAIVANMGLCGEVGGFGKTVFLTRKEAAAALQKIVSEPKEEPCKKSL